MTAEEIFISKLTQTLISLVSVSDRDWETFLRYTVEDGEKLNDKNQLGLLEKDKRNLPDHPELAKTVTFSEHVEITDISPPRSVQRESSPIYITQSNDEYGIPTRNSDNIHNLSDHENLRTFPGQSIFSEETYPEYANVGPLYAGICLPELLKVITQQYPDTMDDYMNEEVSPAAAMLAARLPYEIDSSVCSSCGRSLASMASDDSSGVGGHCSSRYHRLLSMATEYAQEIRRRRERSRVRTLSTAHSDARHATPLETRDLNQSKRDVPADREQFAQRELTQFSSKSALEVSLEGTAHNLEDLEVLARNVISYRLSSAMFVKLGWTKNCECGIEQQT